MKNDKTIEKSKFFIDKINVELLYLYSLYVYREIMAAYRSDSIDLKILTFNKFYRHYCSGCKEYHYYYPKPYDRYK